MLKIAACIIAAICVGLAMMGTLAMVVVAKLNKVIAYDLCR